MAQVGFSRTAFGPVAQRGVQASLVATALGLGWYFELLPCPWALLLGIPCPGCGLSRAASLLLHGEWERALLLHPLSPLLVPLVLAAALRAGLVHVRGPVPPAHPVGLALRRWQGPLFGWLACLVLALWGARFLGAFGGPVPVIPIWAR